MSPLSPHWSFALLLAGAVALLAVGGSLARKEESVRIERNRDSLRHFAGELQRQLHQLDRLYQSHLAEIARTGDPTDEGALLRACNEIVGVRQFSLVAENGRNQPDIHVPIERPRGDWPQPAFRQKWDGLPRVRVQLSGQDLLKGAESSGWIDEPGKPLMFWLRRSAHEAVVLLIDATAVAEAMNRSLAEWSHRPFEPVRVGGGPDELLSPTDQPLARVGDHGEHQPDLILPLRTRFGTWQLASWDRWETRVSYNAPALAATGALAAFIAFLGLFLFIQQRRALRRAEERVSFVNRVSHELRTPLTNILLNMDLAHESVSEVSETATRRLEIVQEETRRLVRLVDNVLTFSRHEQGKLTLRPRPCIPARVVDATVEQFAPAFARRALEVRRMGDLSRTCLVDADALAQVLANLLSNVEKYVPPGGGVEIRGEMEDGTLVLTVADDGPGISPQEAEHVFCAFERLENRVTEGTSGTGLGLAIARDLATSMGGLLSLVPSTRGASFELRIPAPAAPQLAVVNTA